MIPHPSAHRIASLLTAMVVLATGLGGCSKVKAHRCQYPDGTTLFCPGGSECAAMQPVCITTPCGNGNLDPGEQCDDGNVRAGDGCSADCTSNEQCDNGVWDKNYPVNEACDASAPDYHGECYAQCTSTGKCNDGVPTEGEQCDWGKDNDDHGRCTTSCRWNVCGDGLVFTGQEECDDPDKTSGQAHTDCRYGERSCTLCSYCHRVSGRTSYCGDGVTDRANGEECDTRATYNQERCPYGQASCTACSVDCKELHLAGATCGDGNKDGGEECDDIRSFACGRCRPPGAPGACTYWDPAVAKGWLYLDGNDLAETQFTLGSGFAAAPVTFEFVSYTHPTPTSGGIPISINALDDAHIAPVPAIVWRTAQAVNDADIGIRAEVRDQNAGKLYLENLQQGVTGNVKITVVGRDADRVLLRSEGMSEGRGCKQGQLCASNQDCVNTLCVSGICM